MSTRSRRALVACLVTGGSLVLAWIAPTAAVAVVWPLYLLVPGGAVVVALRPRIGVAGRLGLAIVLSVAVSTHLVHWLSHLAGGYGREIVFVAAALLALPIPIAAWRGGRLPSRTVIRRAVPALVVAGLAALVVGLTLGVGMWRVTPTAVVSGGSNWSDLGVHLSIAETLNAGANFPPEVPYFSGVPLVYHWFADFHAAILASAAGIFSVPAMIAQSAMLAAGLVLLVASLARRLVGARTGRRAATLAAALAVFGGGLGYLRFIGDVTAGLGPPLELIAAHNYDNQWLVDWPYFRIPSVMGTGFLAHRATAAGLPILVGAVLLLVTGLSTARQRAAGWRDRPWVIGTAGLLGALLAPFHFFFFPVLPLIALAWVVVGGRLVDRHAPRNALLLLGPYLLSIPFVVPPVLQAAGAGALRLVIGWAAAPRDDGPAALAFFYLTNLGLPFVLALTALLVPRLPHRRFLAAWILVLFLVPNVVQFSVIDFDMNKYFQAMWIAVAVAAGWLIARWPWPALLLVFAISVPSPLLVAGWTATSRDELFSRADLAAAEWVSRSTPPDAVFVTDGWVNSLTDAAGRRRLTTFGPYIANLGYEPDERIGHVLTIYCGGDPELSATLMRRYEATHVIDAGRPPDCAAPVEFGASEAFELVYDAGPRIWRLQDP